MTHTNYRPDTDSSIGTDRIAALEAAYDIAAARHEKLTDATAPKAALALGAFGMAGPVIAATQHLPGWPFVAAPVACAVYAVAHIVRIGLAETEVHDTWSAFARAANTAGHREHN
jgi:hypothetical protein